MKKLAILPLATLLIALGSCKEAKKETKEGMQEVEESMDKAVEEVTNEIEVEKITFTLEPKSDSNVNGKATFESNGEKVMMIAKLSGLTPGEHAIHLHEKADCSSADGKSTGGHWNPTFKPHGKWGAEEGYHKGDIGNFTADEEGNATVEFVTDEWCIGCEDETKNILGKAVIVHQGVDDYTSQPSGAAGARVACTGIIQ